jgi:putative DNA primase/helicase
VPSILPNSEAAEATVADVLTGCDPLDRTGNATRLMDAGWSQDEANHEALQFKRKHVPLSDEHNTDLGNARVLVRFYGDRIRYVFERRSWLAWDGRRWATDATGAVHRYAKDTVGELYARAARLKDGGDREKAGKWASQSENVARIDAMVKLASTNEDVAITPADLDTDTWALNAGNGIVDLRTGELRPHDPAAMHSKLARAEYRPDAPRDRWNAFLEEVLPDADVREFVQRLVGYSLTGEVGENVLPFAYGSGANGKSVFFGVLRDVLGDYAREGAPDLLVHKRFAGNIPADVAELRGYRFVTAQEVEGGRRMATDVMKRITGEPVLMARRLHQNYEEFRNVTTLWLAGNDRPAVDGLDEAVWRRIRLIPFTVTIPASRRDPHLIAKLTAERDGILAWAVDGALAWQRDGLQPPQAVILATDEYRNDSNPVLEWVESDCELDSEAFTPAADLRKSYEAWCRLTRQRPLPTRSAKWTEALERLGCEQHRTMHARGWNGIRLRKGSDGLSF